MYCAKCGGEIAPGKRFCSRCGAAVGGGAGTSRPRALNVWPILPWICLILLVGAVALLLVGGYVGLGRPAPPEAAQVQAQFRPQEPAPPPPPPPAPPAGVRVLPRAPGERVAAGGVVGGIIGGVPQPAPETSPPAPAVQPIPLAPPSGPQRIQVGGNVQQAKLVSQVPPVYPALAKQARIQGTVRFRAIIGVDGTITNLQLISGHPLLVPDAQAAVRQWVYQPTLINGQPVEVVTQIDVVFSLQ